MTKLLQFSPTQEAAILAARSAFNRRQQAMTANTEGELIGNAALVPLDAWRRIDARSSRIQRDVLAVFNRLAAANTTPLDIGDLVSYFPKVGDSGEVNVSLDGRSEARADQALVEYEGTPVPILDSYARFGWRQMAVMAKSTMGLDTETIANHQRKVAEKMEDLVLNGDAQIRVAGARIWGLRTFPGRSTTTHGLDLNGTTGANWLSTISTVVQRHVTQNAYGRATIFLNWGDWTYAGLNQFSANYPKTILQKLLEIPNVAEIVPASKVPVNDVISIAGLETGEWGSILSAMPLTTRPKTRINPEDDYVFGVMAAVAPQFRRDLNGASSIVHLTKA
jgi:uncharacterized linocin/CFP29 family protein